MTNNETESMTFDEFKERLSEYPKCPDALKEGILFYMENVEDQLESNEFLPGLDVTWTAACALLEDIVMVAHEVK